MLNAADLNNFEPQYSIRLDGDGTDQQEGCLQFVVEVRNSQFNLEAPEHEGRILVAAETATTHCKTRRLDSEDFRRRIFLNNLHHVQAFASPTDVDRHAGVQWLKESSSPRNQRVRSYYLV